MVAKSESVTVHPSDYGFLQPLSAVSATVPIKRADSIAVTAGPWAGVGKTTPKRIVEIESVGGLCNKVYECDKIGIPNV